MKFLSPLFLATAIGFGGMAAGATGASAAMINGPALAGPSPHLETATEAEPARHRRWRRRRHGPRYHRRRGRYRYYHGGFWYTFPWWAYPPAYYAPPPRRYGRCVRWQRRCRANWGYGPNFRGCMRYHGC